jgi:hypothetical protein
MMLSGLVVAGVRGCSASRPRSVQLLPSGSRSVTPAPLIDSDDAPAGDVVQGQLFLRPGNQVLARRGWRAILALVSTAGMIPEMIAGGAIELLAEQADLEPGACS